jgi:beta-glucosidase
MKQDVPLTQSLHAQDPALSPSARAANLLSQMTLAEKIGQITQVEKNSITPAEVREYFIGSVLSGGGGNPTPNTPQTWSQMVRSFQEPALETRLAIPLIYGSDAVHGHSNVRGAVIFPHNVGLGATRDAELVERIGRITAKECAATGVHWDFAPSVSVPQDIRWGRTYEGFSEDTELVSRLGTAFVRGLQHVDNPAEAAVLASVKHYVADGGTRWGSGSEYPWLHSQWRRQGDWFSIDQGNAEMDEQTLRDTHLAPYRAAIAAGALNIMVSYSSWRGLKMHADKYLLTDVLKHELGFEGFLVSDWQAIDQLDPVYYKAAVLAINAGLDMIMVPHDFKRFIQVVNDALQRGDISQVRIDDAVRRILTVKFQLGLFEHPLSDDLGVNEVGSQAHREVACEAVRKSLVLLKNDNHVLPLSKALPTLLVAGQAADDIGFQCGGWSIEWTGRTGDITPGTSILEGIRQTVSAATTVTNVIYAPNAEFNADVRAEVGIAVIGEEPYVEGQGDRADLSIQAKDIALITRLRQHCTKVIVILLSGRPLIVTEQLPNWNAFVAAWLPGTEGKGIVDVLFGDYPFTGKLPHTWPRDMTQVPRSEAIKLGIQPLWPLGYGLQG